MLILRIRRAETALADARLDEAFALAQAPDLAAHHKGQKLIGRLARALADRGQKHLSAGRLDQASADCQKAAFLAGSLPEVAALRSAITEATTARHRLERHRGDVLAAAREHVDNGRLSIGEQCLADEPDNSRIADLRDKVAVRRAQAQSAIERSRQALDREDYAAAALALYEAQAVHAHEPQVAEMTTELVSAVCTRAASAIDTGRLDLVESILEPAIRVAGDSVPVRELTRFLLGCREAFAGVNGGQPAITAEALQRLAAMRPSATWLTQAARDARQAAESLQTLRAGPLGLLGLLASNDPAAARPPLPRGGHGGVMNAHNPARFVGNPARPLHLEETLDHPAAHPSPMPAAQHFAPAQPFAGAQPLPPLPRGGQGGCPDANHAALPAKLLVHVDGVGTYLLLRDRRITIGPASSSRYPDVALLAEPNLAPVTIERLDEDYFVSCASGVNVNGAAAKRKLLANGDRITVSPRARARFVMPNAASTTAVLQLAGTRLPASDARQVILMDRECILGPGASAHIRADQLADQAILQTRDGRLFCRSKETVLVNEKPLDRHAGLPLGARIQVGAVSFVVTAA